MADNGSNSVAIVAIVIIVALAIGGFFYFSNKGGFSTVKEPTKVEVNMPSAPTGEKSNTTP